MEERRKLNHEVGSVYIDRRKARADRIAWAGQDFDKNFMSEVTGAFIGSMAIFGVLFTIILVL